MFEVKWKDDIGNKQTKEFNDLGVAITYSKKLNRFVSIAGDDFELVGIFGVDSVEEDHLPNGDSYTWRKRRSS